MSVRMELPGVTFEGPEIDDPEVFDALPSNVQRLLAQINGVVAFDGGLHVRGACLAPRWHSLRAAWWGPEALHRRYDAVGRDDVPFAQDAVATSGCCERAMAAAE